MDSVRSRELIAAARVADGLVYVAGLAGVVAGGLLFRQGAVAFALITWVLTFIVGAGLRLAAAIGRALVVLLERTDRLTAELGNAPPQPPPHGPPDPWRRWGGWH